MITYSTLSFMPSTVEAVRVVSLSQISPPSLAVLFDLKI
jgi:hypothetical protein